MNEEEQGEGKRKHANTNNGSMMGLTYNFLQCQHCKGQVLTPPDRAQGSN